MSLWVPLYDIAKRPDKEIKRLFFLHRSVQADVLEDLGAETLQSRAQHHLLVGGEGAGKSTLLASLGAELRKQSRSLRRKERDKGTRLHLFPIYLSESALMLGRLSILWAEVLGAFPGSSIEDATWGAAQGGPEPSSKTSEEARLRALTAKILDASAREGLRPVLLLEDFASLLRRIGDQEHSLRGFLLQPGAPIVVATGRTVLPPDYSAAFFDHFKTHYLPMPDAEETQQLLLRYAKSLDRPKLLAKVEKLEPRTLALHLFTQGNPRSSARLFHLHAQNPDSSIETDLAWLLDQETPTHRALLARLSDQAQIVLRAMAIHWSPISLGNLAQGCALPKGTVSSQLDRLRKAGLVRVCPLPGTSRKGYEIAPRRLALWMLAEDPLQEGRRRLFDLARFLQDFLPAQKESQATPSRVPPPNTSSTRLLSTIETLLREKNWGQAKRRLGQTLRFPQPLGGCDLQAWLGILRASLQAGLAEELARFWEQSKARNIFRPWIQVLRSIHQRDPDLLQSLPSEMRPCATWTFRSLTESR